jgi:hypothetical protein
MKAMRLFLFTLAFAALALTAAGRLGASAAGCDTVVVTNDDVVRLPHGAAPAPGTHWALYTRQNGTGDFVVGPATPPSGVGSLSLKTPGTVHNGSDKVYLFNYDHVGTTLSSINAISYSTYRDASSTATPVQVTALNIEVDFNGPEVAGGFTTLVFEPVYNTAQGPIIPGQWQSWDAFSGGNAVWWSTKDIPGVCSFNCFVTWNQILAANPDATILGGFGVNQGGGNDGLIANVDALRLGTSDSCVTYDFEPYRVATTKDACKNGGWQSARRADGSTFKNQGQCVSYVETGK